MTANRVITTESTRFDTACWITLRWSRGTRFYRAHLEQDLWAGWLITQVNGRIGTRLGCARALAQPSIESALLTLAAIAKRRRERGYPLTFEPCHQPNENRNMDTISEALILIKRQVELEATLKESGTVHVTEERELHALRRRLTKFPEATQAVVQAAHGLRRSIAELRADEVESWVNPAHAR
jgi:hypothetical protein